MNVSDKMPIIILTLTVMSPDPTSPNGQLKCKFLRTLLIPVNFLYNNTQSITSSDLISPTRALHFSAYISVPVSLTYLLTPLSRVFLEKLTSKICS
jgi:hypothetical protein